MRVLLETLACGNCGAPLNIPNNAGYVTCRYCKSSLAVRRTGSAAYTEVLDRLDERTERIDVTTQQMSGDMRAVRLYYELERLDREWNEKELEFEVQTHTLQKHIREAETRKQSFVMPVLGLVLGAALFFVLEPYGTRAFSPILPSLIIGLAMVALLRAISRSQRVARLERVYDIHRETYLTAEQEYQDRKTEVRRRLDQI